MIRHVHRCNVGLRENSAVRRDSEMLARQPSPQVKKILFNKPPPDHAFGYQPTPDPEGAREITMVWKDSKAMNASQSGAHLSMPITGHAHHARTSLAADKNVNRGKVSKSLDFTKMNKLATIRCGVSQFLCLQAADPAVCFDTAPNSCPHSRSGITSAKDLPQFRSAHVVTVKEGPATVKAPAPPLPSERDPKHTYGLPASHRTAQVRHSGRAAADPNGLLPQRG